ncbi:tripartite tricarboxylate transporter substrate binding protein [Rhizobium sp. BK376]|jgi:tripartite-type tricarboxylate transporter receptor subunit TctC|uniref:tripartite tricarboxylate transporter substrate binding protein n=1 Tax=Rhizobium sp. BK376 TaxID=2512149 RepID=UPI001046E086|nr:tripartite tricarboxylate transporter substrate binding protein [Rhizobium sp. BK376]TCR85878.1 putative tricarboxylic transport membrane protein [Rhizobium sp. BK376]
MNKTFGIKAICIAAALAILPAGAVLAQEKYPAPLIKMVTHSSPGGGSDVFLREMLPYLQHYLSPKLIVENVTGGSGAKAMSTVASSPTDGSWLYATTPTYIYTSLLSKPDASYKDMEPLVNVFYDPEVVYTSVDSKFQTLPDVIAAAKEGRGKWGAANPASLERQLLEQMKQKTGVNASIVTFEGGGDMQISVLNGTLDIGVGEIGEIRAQLDAGKIRMLAVLGDHRLSLFPDVKTAKEQGIDVAAVKFRGLAGPKNMSPAVIAAWEDAIPKLLEDPKYKKIYTENDLEPGFMKHDEYVSFINKFGDDTQAFLKASGVIK